MPMYGGNLLLCGLNGAKWLALVLLLTLRQLRVACLPLSMWGSVLLLFLRPVFGFLAGSDLTAVGGVADVGVLLLLRHQ